MERSYIKNINPDFINYMGLSEENIESIYSLVNYAIKEKLYTGSKVPYHDLEHIERTLIFSLWLVQKKKFILEDADILLYAILFHDTGRVRGASNKTHGIIGAEVAREKLTDIFEPKKLEAIAELIIAHASKSDLVPFKEGMFTVDEQAYLQEISNIVKDSDALDRIRLKLFLFEKCNPKYLRSEESLAIYKESSTLLKEYTLAKKRTLKNG